MEAGEATTATTRATSEDRQIPPAPRHLTIQPAQMTAALAIATIPMARTNPTALPHPLPRHCKPPPRSLGQARSLVRSLFHREFAGLLALPTSIRPASPSYTASLVAFHHSFNPLPRGTIALGPATATSPRPKQRFTPDQGDFTHARRSRLRAKSVASCSVAPSLSMMNWNKSSYVQMAVRCPEMPLCR
jgi:hypothetical protein